MKVLDVRNVDEAYRRGLELLKEEGVRSTSRAGDVIVHPEPVCTVYRYPNERVLHDRVRDANPFFHLMEALWMLSGSRDARWLDRFVRDFSSRYAEDDGQMHGAYGYRWRRHFCDASDESIDQLKIVGLMLSTDHDTRRAALAMWDPVADLGMDKRDIPCNTHVYFQTDPRLGYESVLNMTVCCRSNDIIWGAYGANAVHMSVMGEVVAGLAGMKLGTYRQISNNYHAYMDLFDKLSREIYSTSRVQWTNPYSSYLEAPTPIVSGTTVEERMTSAEAVLRDCEALVNNETETIFETPFFWDVVRPMWDSHTLYRVGMHTKAVDRCLAIRSRDWREATREWLVRRQAGKKS